MAITFTRSGSRVSLDMDQPDFDRLLRIVRLATAAARRRELFWNFIDFANEVNRTNPDFQPYEIPEEFQRKGSRV